jgi:hypothetical protein
MEISFYLISLKIFKDFYKTGFSGGYLTFQILPPEAE